MVQKIRNKEKMKKKDCSESFGFPFLLIMDFMEGFELPQSKEQSDEYASDASAYEKVAFPNL